MRKIISILLTLGVVLGLMVSATPVSADVTTPVVSLSNYCACTKAVYNITFNITASLTEGVGCVCIKFPAGTGVPATFLTGDIKINGVSVFASEITVTGTEVCFIPPADVSPAPAAVLVEFTAAADIVNPCTPGKYTLEVKTCRAPDATYVKSAEYTIVPQYSTYEFLLDFGPTYPGIAPDFVPPFKACGQNMTTTTYDAGIGGFWEPFVLNLTADTVGCLVPCVNATIWFELTAIPAGETIHFDLGGTVYNLTATNKTGVVGEFDAKDVEVGVVTLTVDGSWSYNGNLHFSSPGNYEICFYAECPVVVPCQPEGSAIIAERCIPFKVYQWKDAFKMTLDEKWNLISLPLVPLADPPIADLLLSIPAADRANILSIWHYDRCADEWLTWAADGSQTSLTELVDGEAYWMRLKYPLPPDCGNITWWVWGTENYMPDHAPAMYPVCEGWNMVGFLNTVPSTPSVYLWNWDVAPKPVVYGWDHGCWTDQGWDLVDFGSENMEPGQGYWVAFPHDGAIYPNP